MSLMIFFFLNTLFFKKCRHYMSCSPENWYALLHEQYFSTDWFPESLMSVMSGPLSSWFFLFQKQYFTSKKHFQLQFFVFCIALFYL